MISVCSPHDALELQFLSWCFCASRVFQLLSFHQSDMLLKFLLIKLWTWWNVTMPRLTYERLWFLFFIGLLCVYVCVCVCSKWPCHLVVLQPQVFLSMGYAYTNFTINPHNKVTFTGDEGKDLWQAAELIARVQGSAEVYSLTDQGCDDLSVSSSALDPQTKTSRHVRILSGPTDRNHPCKTHTFSDPCVIRNSVRERLPLGPAVRALRPAAS